MVCCCAVGCINRSEKGFKLFIIPTGKNDVERRKIWLAKIKRDQFTPTKGHMLCEVHFEKSQFERNNPRKLKPNAVPTLFAPIKEVIHRKSPTKRCLSNDECEALCSPTKIHSDHSYAGETENGNLSENILISGSMSMETANSDSLTTAIEKELFSPNNDENALRSLKVQKLEKRIKDLQVLESELKSLKKGRQTYTQQPNSCVFFKDDYDKVCDTNQKELGRLLKELDALQKSNGRTM